MVTHDQQVPSCVSLVDWGDKGEKGVMSATVRLEDLDFRFSETVRWSKSLDSVDGELHGSDQFTPGRENLNECTPTGLAISTDLPTQFYLIPRSPKPSHINGNQNPIGLMQTRNKSDRLLGKHGLEEVTFLADEMAPHSPTLAEKRKNRRSLTIRTAIRKVFGRKDRQLSKVSFPPPIHAVETMSIARHRDFRSDALPSPQVGRREKVSQGSSRQHSNAPKRTTYMEDCVANPPPAHVLPFPININAPQSSSIRGSENSASFFCAETAPNAHQRRATLPSSIISPEDGQMLKKMWSIADGLTKNEFGRHGVNILTASVPKSGTATRTASPTGGRRSPLAGNSRRRSNSVGALNEKTMQRERSVVRRRSSEIVSWRNSKIDSRRAGPTSDPDSQSESLGSLEPESPPRQDMAVDELSPPGEIRHPDVESNPVLCNSTDNSTQPVTEEALPPHTEKRLSQLETNMQHLLRTLKQRTDALRARVDADSQTCESEIARCTSPQQVPGPNAFANSVSWRTVDMMRPATANPVLVSSRPHCKEKLTADLRSSPQRSPRIMHPSADESRLRYLRCKDGANTAGADLGLNRSWLKQIHEHTAPLYEALSREREARSILESQVSQLSARVNELSKVLGGLGARNPHAGAANTVREASSSITPVTRVKTLDLGEMSRFSGYDSDTEEVESTYDNLRKEDWPSSREESMNWKFKAESEMF